MSKHKKHKKHKEKERTLDFNNIDVAQLAQMLSNIDIDKVSQELSKLNIDENVIKENNKENNKEDNLNIKDKDTKYLEHKTSRDKNNVAKAYEDDKTIKVLKAIKPMVNAQRCQIIDKIIQLYSIGRIINK
ncbi:hypothetical protein CLOACE_12430 [Clostridium acetireducens DSM 10703]|jgi:hypothetical protein|uniref:Uncharacterized protein n=1 Tax=Clostridium acetireducens DSM 10703 TaxID=1121290 RepID=A0A1E8EYN1_9CLOT|nr:hypothetical protein [Clostridium acetireducens]OFI06100.1 hypothetical protein CLOACE_12430 [Clostridium acetireducens DSM 10703]